MVADVDARVTMRPMASMAASRFVRFFFVLGLASCTHVAPYDRAQLAHPTMTTSDLARSAEDHVRAIQEGAAGGGFSAGGGCGCN
jgi:hypothetical protein